MDDLDRTFRRLVQNVRASFPDYVSRPFEVAELYQTIIPYRHNRNELGIDVNQDYEVALMRLLSGERGYVTGDPAMQTALQTELKSSNPDTSLFRGYATNQVGLSAEAVKRLDQYMVAGASRGAGGGNTASPGIGASSRATIVPDVVAQPAPPPAAPAAFAAAAPPIPPHAHVQAPAPMAAAPAPRPASPPLPATVPAPPARPVAMASPTMAPGPQPTVAGGGDCRYCAGQLPDGRPITFCPHCGQNLTVRHCDACGAELELGWQYCVTCGRQN